MQDGRLQASLGNALVRLFRLVNRAHGRALKPHDVTTEQAHVLSVLWSEGPLTIGALQRLLALSSPTLTGGAPCTSASFLLSARCRAIRGRSAPPALKRTNTA